MLLTIRSGRSPSVTFSDAAPALKPLAEARTVADWVPSITPSATGLTSKRASVWPWRMVTVAGVVSSVVSLLLKVTTRSPSAGVLRLTVPPTGPPSSPTDSASSVTLRVGPSSSVTMTVPVVMFCWIVPPAGLIMDTVTTTVLLPSTSALLTGLTLKNSVDSPAGKTTRVGAVSALLSLELR